VRFHQSSCWFGFHSWLRFKCRNVFFVENTKFTTCRLDDGVRFLSATRQAFEEMEDDSSSSSSSFWNSSISSGSSMDMSDDDHDEWSDDNDDISDGELSFAFSFAFDKASTIANKLNQPIEHQGIQWRRKHGLKIVFRWCKTWDCAPILRTNKNESVPSDD